MKIRTIAHTILYTIIVISVLLYSYYYFFGIRKESQRVKRLTRQLQSICNKLVEEIDSKTPLGISIEQQIKKETIVKLLTMCAPRGTSVGHLPWAD